MRQLASLFLLIVLSGCASRAGEYADAPDAPVAEPVAVATTPEETPSLEAAAVPTTGDAVQLVEALSAVTAAAPSPTIAEEGIRRVIGLSRENREIHATTYGTGSTRVYVIGSIHGDEDEGRSALAQLQEHLGAGVLSATVRLVEDMNPDGSERGTRTCSTGVDLNRNWPATNFKPARQHGPSPLSEPEAAAVHEDIVAFDPHIVVVLHSARRGPFVNFDGPGAAEVLAERFADAARTSGDGRWRTVADMGYPTPGSMGSYFGKDRQIPILTVEFKRGDTSTDTPGSLVAGLRAVADSGSSALSQRLARLSDRPAAHVPRHADASVPASSVTPNRADLGR